MTDNYLLSAKAQLDRDLVPGHPLRRAIDELIETRKERDEARDVARKLLTICRARGPEPFGLTMAMWLFEDKE